MYKYAVVNKKRRNPCLFFMKTILNMDILEHIELESLCLQQIDFIFHNIHNWICK